MSQFMLRALELAEKARGKTSPNPMVGAVIVRDGAIVGEGFHLRAGEHHAEIIALEQAGENARGATLYINLEPCCHYGKTPPCTDAIIAAGIRQVHMAILDPNPLVQGKGKRILEEAGIETSVGCCAQQALQLNEVFCYWIEHKLPFVIAKFAMSLDGKIATKTGHSRWISSQESRLFGHRIRNEIDAIIVGANTVKKDNPMLTTRLENTEVQHPIRVVIDSKGGLPHEAKIFSDGLPGQTILATTIPQRFPKNVEVMVLPQSDQGVCTNALLKELGKRGITSVLLEGGGTILSSFLANNHVNKILAFIAPMIIGGKEAPSPVAGEGINYIEEAFVLKDLQVSRLAGDILISGYCKRGENV
ncbi:bifunctional diaminohydroxyphosphoribosylaminopyrimidine deaminase/5-amino-6-(5-phosphoribosylamino)uracil reductase RibD [Candidatus Uabimicrobium amorphum]|uniref:Riboflavin biosynthesis protein RibD n=1 Tax=Uabimicrobium amorphum TaxID=2596890 RepID=A0A5S9F2Y5_UABAM|nr:bifunctional diaminohydroxyphosphoribosylaminopyrimidine deaminase/5-amino-6-(5-phosphoribosylamino)uracil reductase RibD [Candidatus Uabimicrobium amorphum]BBM82602.1 riboflavin biosynthesis protein RibD [Candidatus Uabimicrobium amorphum]